MRCTKAPSNQSTNGCTTHGNNPADIKQWNTAQEDWHTTLSTVDLREGGKFLPRMEAKDGSDGFDKTIEYRMSDGREVRSTRRTVNPPELQRAGWQAIPDNFARHVLAKG